MFDAAGVLDRQVPAFVRAVAGVRVRFAQAGPGRTVRTEAAEWGGLRARFPDAYGEGPCECVLVNTGGGMAGGDAYAATFALDDGAQAVVTTQAAEKIYRSDGPDTVVSSAITLGARSSLVWAPQEAILFSRARLARTLVIDMAADASLIACESVYFGRAAMGETLADVAFTDRWRVRRAGRLIFADDVRMEGDAHSLLARPAIANGARAAATVLMAAPGAGTRIEAVREAMAAADGAPAPCEFGVSGLDDMLVARLLGPDAAALRAMLARFITLLSGRPLPRSWQS
jgi:urease accessory protein